MSRPTSVQTGLSRREIGLIVAVAGARRLALIATAVATQPSTRRDRRGCTAPDVTFVGVVVLAATGQDRAPGDRGRLTSRRHDAAGVSGGGSPVSASALFADEGGV
jgi:hypothetical protein